MLISHVQGLKVGLLLSTVLALNFVSAPTFAQATDPKVEEPVPSETPAEEASSIKGWVEGVGLFYENDGRPTRDQIGALSGQVETQVKLSDNFDFSVRAFGRLDPNNSNATYVDLPIAKLTYKLDDWQFAAGFDTVFWGVAESQRVVNVINQPDFIRSMRGDVTQGQPMVSVNWFGETFRAEAYVLPYFRERRFAGGDYRVGLPLPVSMADPIYESAKKQRHVDFAGRVSASLGGLELGVSAFSGTLRDPVFVVDGATSTLVPFYRQGQQYGLDAQYTIDSTLLKLEARYVTPNNGKNFMSAVYGVEHVLGGVFGSPYDLTLFVEHNYDNRGRSAPNIYQNDIFIGGRLDFANTLGTTLTVGAYYDLDYGSTVGRLALESRLSDSLKFSVEAITFKAKNPKDALYNSRNLDQILAKLLWSF